MGALPCIRCDKALTNVFDLPGLENQPYDATAFTTKGHYGSSVFDAVGDASHLELNICDDCLMILSASNKILLHKRAKATAMAGESKEMQYWKTPEWRDKPIRLWLR